MTFFKSRVYCVCLVIRNAVQTVWLVMYSSSSAWSWLSKSMQHVAISKYMDSIVNFQRSLVFTPDQARFLAATRVCVRLLTSAAAARPGLPAGIYWLALCPAAGGLVRSVLTTSAPQRHLWAINSDMKAVDATAEPTHAANWCFSMRKLLKHHWR